MCGSACASMLAGSCEGSSPSRRFSPRRGSSPAVSDVSAEPAKSKRGKRDRKAKPKNLASTRAMHSDGSTPEKSSQANSTDSNTTKSGADFPVRAIRGKRQPKLADRDVRAPTAKFMNQRCNLANSSDFELELSSRVTSASTLWAQPINETVCLDSFAAN